jgi:hypothetical protein
MKEARFWPKMKFEPIFFSGSLAVFQSERVASAGGRTGGLGGIPPALQILGEISSNFFESTPPIPRVGPLTAKPIIIGYVKFIKPDDKVKINKSN